MVTGQAGVADVPFRFEGDPFSGIARPGRNFDPLKGVDQDPQPASGRLRGDSDLASQLAGIDLLRGQSAHQADEPSEILPIRDICQGTRISLDIRAVVGGPEIRNEVGIDLGGPG